MIRTLLQSVLVFIYLHCIALSDAENKYKGKCHWDQDTKHAAFTVLNKLQGKRYHCKDGGYTYYVGICTPAKPDLIASDPHYSSAGAVQVDDKETDKNHVVGSYESADFIKGNDWLMLTYKNGDEYGSHCTNERRSAIIQIACEKGNTDGTLDLVEENNVKTNSCYYLFELKHDAVCPTKHFSLSTGSILCIVFFSVVAVYLIVGLIVQRAVRGAQSWEQIPNYTFWKAVGNYSADGCDLVFRSKDSGLREYRGVSGNDYNQEISRESHQPDDPILSM